MRPRKSTRRVVPPPPDVDALIKRLTDASEPDVVAVLKQLQIWRYPRADMNSFLPVTKKFGQILANIREMYAFGAAATGECKLQIETFSPEDRTLVLEILRFFRLLMENSTNRKQFDGYEYINDLLLTNDPDVLQAALFVLQRSLQQYGTQLPVTPELAQSIRARLLALSKGWDRFSLADLDLEKLASETGKLEIPDDVAQLKLQFYPPAGVAGAVASPAKSIQQSSSAPTAQDTPTRPAHRAPSSAAVTPLAVATAKAAPTPDNGMVTVDLGNILNTMTPDNYLQKVAKLPTAHKMDVTEQLNALNKIRVILFSGDRESRRKLLSSRLLALACYIMFTSEDVVQSTIWLFEPELVNHMAELLVPGRDVGESVVATAVLALEAAAHHRTEVLTSINAHVSHGVLMGVLRSIAQKLTTDAEISYDVVDAVLAFLSYINSQPQYGNLLVGAGLLPNLLQMLDTKGPRRNQIIPRTAGLIDSAVFSHQQALQALTSADGVNVIVGRIKAEVQNVLDNPAGPGTEMFSRDSEIAWDTNPLKALLRSIYRLLQSTGGSEGFRNVVDTDLPKSLKLIFTNADQFGMRNFSLAINIMSTIVHNEPTSLAILQEMQLPQTLFDVLEKKMPDTFEVVYTLPNAIGAICLNQAGLDSTLEHFSVVANMIKMAIGWTVDSESGERDQVASIGASLDELVRHHPGLRPKVLETVVSVFKNAIAEAEQFRPPLAEVNEYTAEPASASEETAMEVESPKADSQKTDKSDTPKDQKVISNPPLSKLTNILKLLTGLLRNAAMCRAFVNEENGLDMILNLASLPCIPVRFSLTEAAVAIPGVLRVIGDHNPVKLTERMTNAVKDELDALPQLWKDSDAHANWAALTKEDGSPEEHLLLRRAAGLAMRLSFLSEYLSMNFGSKREATDLIKLLGVTSGSPLMDNLGQLHRIAFQEHVILKDVVNAQNPPSEPATPAITDAPAEGAEGSAAAASGEATGVAAPAAATVSTETTVTAPGDTSQSQLIEIGRDASDISNKPPTRAQTVKTIATRMHAILTKFFKAAIRLIFNKRLPDASHKPEADALGECIATIIIGHLQSSAQVPSKAFAIDTVALGLAAILLFDERGVEGSMQTTLFIPFEKKGGVNVILDTVSRILCHLDKVQIIPQADRTKEQAEEWKSNVAGARIATSILEAISSYRALVNAAQTTVIQERESVLPPEKRFQPHATHLRIECAVIPTAFRLWNSSWLPHMDQDIISVANCMVVGMMNNRVEKPRDLMEPALVPSDDDEPPVPQPLRPQVTADPARVTQLTEMGFGRGASQRALVRTRNNVGAAADLLLSMPHLFPNDDPGTDDPPAPAENAEAAPAAAEGSTAEGAAAASADGAQSTQAEPSTSTAAPTEAGPSTEGQSTEEKKDDKEGEAGKMDDKEENMEVDKPDLPSPETVFEQAREQLFELREKYKPGMPERAIEIIDQTQNAIPDLLGAFEFTPEGAQYILKRIQEAATQQPIDDKVLSARLRLLAVFIDSQTTATGGTQVELTEEQAKDAMQILMSIPIDMEKRPTWLSEFLLAVEAVFQMGWTITPTSIGDDAVPNIVTEVDFGDAYQKLQDLSLKMLAAEDISRPDMMSAMRMLLILTRRAPAVCTPDVMKTILGAFKTSTSHAVGSFALLAIVARHSFEKDALKETIDREVGSFWIAPFGPGNQRNGTELDFMIRQLRQVAYRDPTLFVEAVQDQFSLVNTKPQRRGLDVNSKVSFRVMRKEKPEDEKKDEKESAEQSQPQPQNQNQNQNDPFQRTNLETFENQPIMDLLVSELGTTLRSIQQEEANKRNGIEYTPACAELYSYALLLMAIMTELVGSYISAKKAFMAAVRKHMLYGVGKGKSGLGAILTDVIACVSLSDVHNKAAGAANPASQRRLTMSSWGISLMVALCSNLGITPDIKEIPEDLITVRKAVLDGISKALKDPGSHSLDLGSRYGRLWALGELIYRLLTARPAVVPKMGQPADDSGLHLAKTMLEKNFVSTMTSAVSEVDLNYPDVRNVLLSLLKALEYLTKISNKWGKSENSKGGESEHTEESEEDSESTSDDSEMDMSDDDEGTPDLYRNSALGIIGGDIDVDDEDDDMDGTDDEDEDDLMEAFADEMEHDMDDDEGTEPSDDSEDDMEEDDDMEGEWATDEDEEDVEEDQAIEVGAELDDMVETEIPWEEDDMGEEEDVEEYDSEDEDQYDDNDIGMEFDMDEEDEELAGFDENGYDALDAMDGLGPSHMDLGEPTGAWGWQDPAARSGPRSRLMDMDRAPTSLFGFSRREPINVNRHPLLYTNSSRTMGDPVRSNANPFGALSSLSDLISSIEGLGGPQAVQFLESVVHQSRHSGADTIRVDLAHRSDGGFGLSIGGRSISVAPPSRTLPSTPEEVQREYRPAPTLPRWMDELGVFPHDTPELQERIFTHIVNRLMPAALRAAAEEEERKEKAEQEAEEAAAKKREEEAAHAASVALPESRPETALSDAAAEEDVEMISHEGDSEGEGESEDEEAEDDGRERVTINIHGEEVDITDTGIDLEFLEALPEDMRADVVEQHLREQNRLMRPPASDIPAGSSQINAEFLNALPPEIRAEVVMQEAMEQERARRTTQPEPEPAPIAEPPLQRGEAALRELLAGTTDALFFGPDGVPRNRELGGPPGLKIFPLKMAHEHKPKRDAIQLLDKAGIASLVRLLFVPEAIRKGYLIKTLVHLCENSKTRTDLLNVLLSIVQDGSGDLPAVDKSFQQMSLKGLTTPQNKSTPKGKVMETPASQITSGLFAHLQSDHIPTFIAQRCFEALSYIVNANQQAVTYFLTEHEQPVGLKKPASKKGKGKEKYIPQTKYPIVILIGLLDRPNLLKAPGMMESLTSLLAAVTKPLAQLPQQEKEAQEAKEGEKQDAAPAAGAITAPPTAQAPTGAGAAAGTGAAASSSTALEKAGESSKAATTKEVLKAPVIPAPVLRLVINCLTIGDCSSKTFRETLSALQNLSYIPDAKPVLVQELCSRSQQLGGVIEGELRELATMLADKDHEVSGDMLTTFSPAGSSQAQLLRLLKTIDYLHSHPHGRKPETEKEQTEDEKAARDIYNSFNFSQMWRQLSDCLTLAEERESTDQIAAVLLPLVEALMVVCKYTRTPQTDTVASPMSPMSPSSTDNAQSADLFISFTTTHRKVLNAIVRHNPALMSGSFSLLIANPKVLEFDNKRNWFFQKLRRKREALNYGTLHLNVRRQYVFQDSYSALLHRSGDEIKYGKINIKFINEDGVDAGGVTREWFHVLATQIFDPNFALFEPCAADKQTYQPNKHSSVVDDHLSFFKFVGRVIGKAIYDGRLLDAYFSRAFYKQILGREVDMRDLESIDPEYHKSLQWILDNDITDVIDQEFTIEDDSFGETKIVELKEGGAKIPVTEENKEEYVRLVCAYRLENSIRDQMKAFLTGFYDIIPQNLIQIFEPDQLELLISGMTTIDVDELKNSTQMTGWKSSDPEISWFWRALRGFSQEERSRFLMFVTSSSRVPLGGFSQLQGASGTQPFQIQKLYGKEGILPQASTCFNLLLLPKYASYEQLREKLLFAITETSGFGKA